MTTAFVLSGDGSLGAVQVGMLQALAERGVQPDLLIGTSAGALNAASAPPRRHRVIAGRSRMHAELASKARTDGDLPARQAAIPLAGPGR